MFFQLQVAAISKHQERCFVAHIAILWWNWKPWHYRNYFAYSSLHHHYHLIIIVIIVFIITIIITRIYEWKSMTSVNAITIYTCLLAFFWVDKTHLRFHHQLYFLFLLWKQKNAIDSVVQHELWNYLQTLFIIWSWLMTDLQTHQ